MRTILTLVICLAIAPTADAYWQRAERAKAVAVAYWGQTPTQCPTVNTFREPMAPEHSAEADRAGCAIYFNEDWWGVQKGKWRFPWFCSVYVHEYGHLLGVPHSDDPGDVMYPTPPRIDACD